MGFHNSREDEESLIHTWRLIGFLMVSELKLSQLFGLIHSILNTKSQGIHDEFNPCNSYANAKAWSESIFMHIVEPDETSIRLAHHSLDAVAGQYAQRSKPVLYQISRFLMGDPLADALKLDKSKWQSCVVRMILMIFHLQKLLIHPRILRWWYCHNVDRIIQEGLKTRTFFHLRPKLTTKDAQAMYNPNPEQQYYHRQLNLVLFALGFLCLIYLWFKWWCV